MTGHNKIENMLRYWHTLRHLRPVQFYGRAGHRLLRPRVDVRPPPRRRKTMGDWIASTARPPMMQGANVFCFLNVEGHIENSTDWNNSVREKLWLYNLHYFDDLNAADAAKRSAWHHDLIDRWITENPAPIGNGWEPYPLSLRIVNWIKWALAGNQFKSEWQQSLAVQIRFLAKRLEWHLLGNHLFANAKALVFAGLFFEGREADGWLDKGLAILAREIPEQVLPDGGHFELSPMYHSIILEDMLDLINLAGTFHGQISSTVVKDWRHIARKMLDWLAVMSHPDGNISFFNDATCGIAAEPRLIDAYAVRLDLAVGQDPGEGLTHLEASGYIRVQWGDMVALLDVAPVGPDYLPGHAHADTLSFELSLQNRRVIVNSGIAQYGSGRERLYQRSTAAHSTLEIDDLDSSEVWGGFRVARRARPVDLNIVEKPDRIIVSCAHNGYHRLKGRVTHRRDWHFTDRSLEIVDTLTGKYDKAVARFHFHPDAKPAMDTFDGSLVMPQGQGLGWQISGGDYALVKSQYYPEFGRSIASNCLTVELSNPQSRTSLKW